MRPEDPGTKKAVRNSNLEILRIICMLMIILSHLCQHGISQFPAEPDANMVFYVFGRYCGQIGVLVFVMISGYFMVTKDISVRRLFRLMLEIWFYSFVILAVCLLAMGDSVTGEMIGFSLVPILRGQWWFVTAYIFLMLLSPFINAAIRNIDSRQYLTLCAVLFMITYVMYMVRGDGYISNLGSLITAYVFAGYIRLHPNALTSDLRNGAVLLVFSLTVSVTLAATIVFEAYDGDASFDTTMYAALAILAAATVLAMLLSRGNKKTTAIIWILIAAGCLYSFGTVLAHSWEEAAELTRSRVAFTQLIVALGLFLTFLNMRPRYNKAVNAFAASTFAAYLIHESVIIREFLWTDWLDVASMFDSWAFPLYAIGCCILVLIVCVAIDKARIHLVFRPLDGYIDRFSDWMESLLRGKPKVPDNGPPQR